MFEAFMLLVFIIVVCFALSGGSGSGVSISPTEEEIRNRPPLPQRKTGTTLDNS